ncbi:hypothetical protein F5Y18DRAFT_444307 [Xylariaceae sp. FL1019]|nr:hypothetical protein F5Y18DRAFT_444307 [Xylariaceae sp. FL1019]
MQSSSHPSTLEQQLLAETIVMKRKFEKGAGPPAVVSWGTQMVTMEASTGTQSFAIHAVLLAYFSIYFRTALSSEGHTYKFTLTEHCDDDVLAMFMGWIYLKSPGNDFGHSICRQKFLTDGPFHNLARAWLFGDHIGAADFQNDLMRVMFASWWKLFMQVIEFEDLTIVSVLETMWNDIPEGSALDKLFIEVACRVIGYPGRRAVADDEDADAVSEFDGHTRPANAEAFWDKWCLYKSLSEDELVQKIYQYPERVQPVLLRRMMYYIKVGRWDPNDDGSGDAPEDLWSWLKVDDFLVPTESEEEEGDKRQRVGDA